MFNFKFTFTGQIFVVSESVPCGILNLGLQKSMHYSVLLLWVCIFSTFTGPSCRVHDCLQYADVSPIYLVDCASYFDFSANLKVHP